MPALSASLAEITREAWTIARTSARVSFVAAATIRSSRSSSARIWARRSASWPGLWGVSSAIELGWNPNVAWRAA